MATALPYSGFADATIEHTDFRIGGAASTCPFSPFVSAL
jgi:hypothetical protein